MQTDVIVGKLAAILKSIKTPLQLAGAVVFFVALFYFNKVEAFDLPRVLAAGCVGCLFIGASVLAARIPPNDIKLILLVVVALLIAAASVGTVLLFKVKLPNDRTIVVITYKDGGVVADREVAIGATGDTLRSSPTGAVQLDWKGRGVEELSLVVRVCGRKEQYDARRSVANDSWKLAAIECGKLLRGSVSSEPDAQPLQRWTVSLVSTNCLSITDETGHFSLQGCTARIPERPKVRLKTPEGEWCRRQWDLRYESHGVELRVDPAAECTPPTSPPPLPPPAQTPEPVPRRPPPPAVSDCTANVPSNKVRTRDPGNNPLTKGGQKDTAWLPEFFVTCKNLRRGALLDLIVTATPITDMKQAGEYVGQFELYLEYQDGKTWKFFGETQAKATKNPGRSSDWESTYSWGHKFRSPSNNGIKLRFRVRSCIRGRGRADCGVANVNVTGQEA